MRSLNGYQRFVAYLLWLPIALCSLLALVLAWTADRLTDLAEWMARPVQTWRDEAWREHLAKAVPSCPLPPDSPCTEKER